MSGKHQGSTGGWAALGSSGLSASFVGDTMWHYLGGSWSYLFNNGTGVYYTSTVGMAGLMEFAYNYAGGQWYHEGQFGGWATLGTAGTSAAFVGDGASHQLDSG